MNAIRWFEIYVNDMNRAKTFYETVFGYSLRKMESPMKELEMWGFPSDQNSYGSGGALCKMEGLTAGGASTIVYFASEDCAVEEKKIAAAGGSIMRPKFSIGTYGFISLGFDTEKNLIGIHSMK
ncbi:MAG: VOC family protein [Bacteriovoracaceae bacterium]